MIVTHFQRKPGRGHFSVERIFDEVRRHLPPHIRCRHAVSRFESKGLFPRIYNILEAPFRGADVNHITGDVHYLAVLLPKRRTVLTILDCVTLNRLTGWRRKILWFAWYWLPMKRAGAITVISAFTKKELLTWVHCDPEKVQVVHVPVSDSFKPQPKPFSRSQPVILHVGSTPNKNLRRVVEALKGIPCRLRVIGKFPEEDMRLLEHSGLDYSIAANLNDAELVREYEQCDMLVFASTYEGFGLPIVEAQAVGRPVVTSDLGPMPEVSGGAACLVDPFSTASIRVGIMRVIDDADYRDELIRKGFENAQLYHPDIIAARYADIYDQLAGVMRAEKSTCSA